MTNLVDHVDRITTLAHSIRAAATPPSNAPTPGVFTRAVLDTPLFDLIRDIDPSELGLFTVVQPQQPAVSEVDIGSVEIARAEFIGATPLRKPPSSRPAKPDGSRQPREHDPEVYANAALKFLDRYQSIRPMPRASEQVTQIIHRLEEVRENMRSLHEQLEQHSGVPPLSPKATIQQEERQINDLQSQIQYLKERKGELARKKARTVPISERRQLKTPTAPPKANEDKHEETFWNTPGAAARTLHFTGDSLLDEEVDFANVSTGSFGTPLTTEKKFVGRPIKKEPVKLQEQAEDLAEDEEAVDEVLAEADDITDVTIVLKRTPSTVHTEEHGPPEPPAEHAVVETNSPPHDPGPQVITAPHHHHKVKVTTEVERIVEKVWATVGDVIMPGHMFDALGTSTNKSKPPRAKETMGYLRELSSHAPAPSSPSASSFSSFSAPAGPCAGPTVQQILTAYMLLALLGTSSHSLTLRTLKELLTEKAASVGASTGAALLGGSAVTKPMYGCVAKRLLKIERGAGEQVVKFDM